MNPFQEFYIDYIKYENNIVNEEQVFGPRFQNQTNKAKEQRLATLSATLYSIFIDLTHTRANPAQSDIKGASFRKPFHPLTNNNNYQRNPKSKKTTLLNAHTENQRDEAHSSIANIHFLNDVCLSGYSMEYTHRVWSLAMRCAIQQRSAQHQCHNLTLEMSNVNTEWQSKSGEGDICDMKVYACVFVFGFEGWCVVFSGRFWVFAESI